MAFEHHEDRSRTHGYEATAFGFLNSAKTVTAKPKRRPALFQCIIRSLRRGYSDIAMHGSMLFPGLRE